MLSSNLSRMTLPETVLYTPAVPNKDALPIAWCYPAPRNVAMSSLGYLALFRQLDEAPTVNPTRVYGDTVETFDPRGVAMMGFSFSFELDGPEILRMLDACGVPLYQAQRGDAEPLIFAGGPVTMTNAEPFADFFDFFLIGEGEEVLMECVAAIQQLSASSLSRQEKLRYLAANIAGCYVPSMYTVAYHGPEAGVATINPLYDDVPATVTKRMLSAAQMQNTIASSPILSDDSVFGNTFLVEVMRGCSHRCRFCMASYAMLPARGSSAATILNTIDAGLTHTHKIGLLGALIADHPEFDAICDGLHQRMDKRDADGGDPIRLNAAALRVDRITERIVTTFMRGGQQQLTLAIESGSERLRQRINKHLKQDKIFDAMETVSKAGLKGIKFYGMVGLPDETDDDVQATIDLLAEIKAQHPKLKLVFGCSSFVPKGGTPFQWMPRTARGDIKRRFAMLEKGLKPKGKLIAEFRPSSAKWDEVQAVFSRGDRRLAPLVERFYRHGGSVGSLKRADKELREEGVAEYPPLDWIIHQPLAQADTLPWQHISLGISHDILWEESGITL